MSQNSLLAFLFFALLLPTVPAPPALPDPASIQSFLPTPSPVATIPAFPEQSDVAGCPLDLPEELFRGVKAACGVGKHKSESGQLHRSRCCPVLAAWLYSAYSETALGRAGVGAGARTASYDLPLLPDDSETCVDSLQKALNNKGVELVKPNETCDVVYCYCGIRLHPLSCPEAFSVSERGKLVGDESVKRLERDCFSNNNANGYAGLAGCSKCLNSLYLLSEGKAGNRSKPEDRTSKMNNKDCRLMGLTWLLAKNRSAYIRTVSSVLRAIMASTDGSDPRSCSINSDGMPLAVDSSEINSRSSSTPHQSPIPVTVLSLCLFLTTLSPINHVCGVVKNRRL